ncbi:hypothetical protein LZL87_013990 [Fusarium oxysporum]|nr:hypothetical protein LZL87_013990 [Fusarium oxysporum]
MCNTFIGMSAELLGKMIGYLSKEDVVNLWKVYDQSHHLNEYLFYPASTLNHTMKLACKMGDSDLIRTAVRWGADPSYIFFEPGEKSTKSAPKHTAERSPESRKKTIHILAPAARDGSLSEFFIHSPLMAYLEAIEGFPVTDELNAITGIQYFTRHGARIQPMKFEWMREWNWLFECVREWDWLRSSPNVNQFKDRICQPLSAVELLLGKWHLEKLHEPQFFKTIRYLIEQGSGVSRAETLIDDFCFDSKNTNTPLCERHPDHPDNTPSWWDLVHLLWNKIEKTYENKYAWVKYSLKPGNKTRGLLDSRVDSQELKDALLYTFVMEGGFLSSPHSYGTLDRLVIDRLQDCGANINAFAGENGQTLLYEICSRINMAYVKTEKGHLLPGHKHPGVAEMYRVKFQELCLSLVDKGADPGLFIDCPNGIGGGSWRYSGVKESEGCSEKAAP